MEEEILSLRQEKDKALGPPEKAQVAPGRTFLEGEDKV